MGKSKIKKGDTVIVISGDDKGTKGEVKAIQPKAFKVVVKGINLIKKTIKKSKEYPNGGFMETEAPINLSNVQLLCPKTGKGVRVGFENDKDGKKIRVARKADLDYKFE